MNQTEQRQRDSRALHCSSTFDRWASVGDVIECEVQNPFRQTLRVRLSTPEACAYGNELIAAGRWRKADVRDNN